MKMLFLLLLFLSFMLLWPAIKLAWKIYKFRRDINRVYRQATGNPRNRRSPGSDTGRTGHYGRPRKKIDSTIGEYIEYEEITVDSTAETERQYSSAHIEYVRQQQISDAEWEELG